MAIEHASPAVREVCGGCRFAALVAVGWGALLHQLDAGLRR